MRADLQDRIRAWLVDDALPLWRGAGVDQDGFGVFEALDHDGAPRADLPKRVRVQARQVFTFATADRAFGTGDRPLAQRLFDDLIRGALEDAGGRLAGATDREGRPISTPHDLYDIAFMILADASLASGAPADGARGANDALWRALGALKAERGWAEALDPAPHRRQNPHMHLFEAALAQVEAGDARYAPVAEECLSLFCDVFFTGGALLEYFDDRWRPIDAGQSVEPGHMAEWVYLLDWYERSTGRSTGRGAGVDLSALFAAAERGRDGSGLLIDVIEPRTTTRRLWPQTEYLKAALTMERRGALPDGSRADAIVEAIFDTYLSAPVAGGWWDQFDENGALLSETMPASSFYHLIVAFLAYLDA